MREWGTESAASGAGGVGVRNVWAGACTLADGAGLRGRRGRRVRRAAAAQRGMVTAELALGIVSLVVLLGLALGVFGVAAVQAQCWDTASEVARQVARGDTAAIERARRDAPEGAVVTLTRDGDVAVVTVEADARPAGRAFAPIRLRAEARVVVEPGVRP